MKKLFLLLLCLVLAVSVCGCGKTKNDGESLSGEESANIKTITPEEYRAGVDELTNLSSTLSDEEKITKIDDLAEKLKTMITYNQETKTGTGNVYYVSENGNDDNDGKSEKTAWATLSKVNGTTLSNGDTVLFERGGNWYGQLAVQNGVTYSAYGKGLKPRISNVAFPKGAWEETEDENIWKCTLDTRAQDIGTVLLDDGKEYGRYKTSKTKLKSDFDFYYDNGKVYLYYEGDLNGDFSTFEFSPPGSVVKIGGKKNVTVHNLELRLGQDTAFAANTENITFSYCKMAWSGGQNIGDVRAGGGTGCWYNCNGFYIDHCYIYQQFDAGVSPQYDSADAAPSHFLDYKVTDCLFEKNEYSFEYFMTQRSDAKNDALFENMYFAYNMCREGGYGFGEKTAASNYVKSWQSHDNFSKNCVIEKNIFDRPAAQILDIGAKDVDGNYSIDQLPKFKNNVYVQKEGKKYATVNGQAYLFKKDDFEAVSKLGFETDAIYIFAVDSEN